jgi:general secretion pathway protein C
LTSKESRWTFAAIKDTTERDTNLYGIGSTVPGGATVAVIHPTEVILRRGEREELLEFEKVTAAKPRAPRPRKHRKMPRPTARLRALARGIRKVGSNRWEIQRNALNKVLSNTTMIARSARIVPSVKNGKPNGFRLLRVRPGSFYSLLGMFNGDTVHAINGHPITTPDKALEVYTKLRSAGHVTISFTRRGKPLTHEYVIR